jgi:hypothetical protein
MIGDAPRSGPFGLRGPGAYNLNMGRRRSFKIVSASSFIFGVDCQNVTNKVTFTCILEFDGSQYKSIFDCARFGQ